MRAEPVNQSDGPFAEGCEPAFLISIEESYALSLLSHSYRRAVQRSDNGHPAVHSERMTNDVARARTAKPQHGRGDLLGLTGATDRNVFRDVFIRLLVTLDDIAGDLRVNQAGIHRIHPDTFSDEFERGRPRQADHALLRSYIGSDSGLPVNAPTDALLTMAPLPWRSICRSSCFMQLHTPRRLIPITRSQSSRVLSAMGAMWAMTPALLNAASIRPNSATVRSTIAATCASSLTSQGMPIALWPPETSFCASAFTTSSRKSANTTAAPASANACAVASPMPDAAPVTSATLFSKDPFILEVSIP